MVPLILGNPQVAQGPTSVKVRGLLRSGKLRDIQRLWAMGRVPASAYRISRVLKNPETQVAANR